jgi:pimeloyl-ACP methyl ester carboxylesterase
MMLAINGMQLHYDTHGAGEPLLWLHGGLGHGADWQHIFREPPPSYRIIAPDLRGHGRSTGASATYSFRQSALDAFALLDHLQVDRVKVIGLSGGGITALHMATIQPARVTAMIVISAPPAFPEQAKAIQRVFSEAMLSEADRLRMRQRHQRLGQLDMLVAETRAMADGGDPSFTPEQLASISADTLIVFGDRDFLYPVSLAVELHQAIPRSWLWVVPNGGHGPVIVGGPGAALSFMAPFFSPWEDHFTVVQWDQPWAGATIARSGETGKGTLSIDRLTRDGVGVGEFVRHRLPGRAIVVLGFSGGSIVGLRLVSERPDLFAAYVGTGQITNWARQQRLAYEAIVGRARAAGDVDAIAELERLGPPPYPTVEADAVLGRHATAMTPVERAVFAGLAPDVSAALKSPPPDARYVASDISAGDPRTLAARAYEALRAEIGAFDAATLGATYRVPMFFCQGDDDVYTATSEVQAFVDAIEAPIKRFERVAGGGHSCLFLREVFLDLLNHVVRPALSAVH